MIKLNEFVDKVYCLNLDRRTDRWVKVSEEFKRLEIDVERFSGIDGKDIYDSNTSKYHMGFNGALKSHRKILKDAIDNEYDKICVFEDDLIFCKDFNERFDYYIVNIPNDWDMMYLGCVFHNCPEPSMVKPHIYKNEKNYGCFAMIINKDMIKYIYELTEPEIEPIDEYISRIVKNFNVYSFIPFFVKTTKTLSDISESNLEFEYDFVNKYFSDELILPKKESKGINNFVDKIYCINLDRRTDRWKLISEEFKRLEIDVERFSSVDGNTIPSTELIIRHEDLKSNIKGAQGALKSHRKVLKDAIDNDYDKICVFEDDLIFCKDFNERFDYYIKNVPTNWDMMYLGCHYHNCENPDFIMKYIYKNNRNYGCFAMIINKDMIKKIYDYTKEETKTIDDYISEMIKNNNCYSFIPFFVKTTNTVSDIGVSNESYEYDVVNKFYSDYAHEFNIIGKFKIEDSFINKPPPPKNPPLKESSILKSFVNSNRDFLIFQNGRQVFDSKNNKNNIYVSDNYFKIYGKQFGYNGIQIKNK